MLKGQRGWGWDELAHWGQDLAVLWGTARATREGWGVGTPKTAPVLWQRSAVLQLGCCSSSCFHPTYQHLPFCRMRLRVTTFSSTSGKPAAWSPDEKTWFPPPFPSPAPAARSGLRSAPSPAPASISTESAAALVNRSRSGRASYSISAPKEVRRPGNQKDHFPPGQEALALP